MAELPTPLITEILSRLPVKSLQRFRSVSKSWRSLIDDKFFINLHLNLSSQNPNHQTLIIKDCFLLDDIRFTNQNPYLYSVDYPTLNRATPIKCPFNCNPLEIEIVGNCNGLICLAARDAAFIFNPATKNYRVLPVSEVEIPGYAPELNRINYGFGYDHVNDDYKLLRIVEVFVKNSDDHVSEVKVYSLKVNNWRKVSEFPAEFYIGVGLCWGAYVNDCLHWMVVRKPQSDRCNVILGFNLRTEEYNVVPQPKYSGVSLNSESYINVGVLQGCLMARAFYPKVRTDVWIMKEYGVRESWIKLFSVPQSECLGLYQCLKPVAYLKRGGSEEVLIEKDFQELVRLDLKRGRARTANICGIPCSFDTALVVESLVPIAIHEEKKPKKKRHDLDEFLSKGFKLKL